MKNNYLILRDSGAHSENPGRSDVVTIPMQYFSLHLLITTCDKHKCVAFQENFLSCFSQN